MYPKCIQKFSLQMLHETSDTLTSVPQVPINLRPVAFGSEMERPMFKGKEMA